MSMNFDKEKFSEILIKIKDSYGSINQMAEKTDVTAAYISKLIRLMYNNAPSPEILNKIASNSNNIITYPELMQICGYYNDDYSLLNALIKDAFAEKENEFVKFKFTQIQKDNLLKIINSFLTSITDNTNELLEPIVAFSNEFINRQKEVYNFITDIINIVIQKYDKQLDIYHNSLSILNSDNININHKLSNSHNHISSQYYMCPVYGRISAGQPNWVEECIEGRIPIDPDMMNITNPEECFFLRVNGESMNKEIKDGAYALIRKTDFVENGEIAVVLVNGFDATLKKFSKQGDLVILEPMSTDSSYTTQVYGKDTDIKIIGKYIGKMEMKS